MNEKFEFFLTTFTKNVLKQDQLKPVSKLVKISLKTRYNQLLDCRKLLWLNHVNILTSSSKQHITFQPYFTSKLSRGAFRAVLRITFFNEKLLTQKCKGQS